MALVHHPGYPLHIWSGPCDNRHYPRYPLHIWLVCWSRKPELRCCLSKGRINLGKPQGVGVSEWETDGEQMGSRWGGMEMRRSVYEQTGTRVDGSYCSKEGFQVSKEDQEREQKGISKGR